MGYNLGLIKGDRNGEVTLPGVDTNFEKLETVGLPTHNFQEPQVKFRRPNFFLQFYLHLQEKAAGVQCYRGVWT